MSKRWWVTTRKKKGFSRRNEADRHTHLYIYRACDRMEKTCPDTRKRRSQNWDEEINLGFHPSYKIICCCDLLTKTRGINSSIGLALQKHLGDHSHLKKTMTQRRSKMLMFLGTSFFCRFWADSDSVASSLWIF